MKPYILYKNGFKYQLYADYSIQTNIILGYEFKTDYFELSMDGTLLIRKGYAWDGPSGPTIDTPDFMRGSLVHDVLYQAMRLRLLPLTYRDKVDKLLERICVQDGMCKFSAHCVYRAVSAFGEKNALPGTENGPLTAP